MIDSHVHMFPPDIIGQRERFLDDPSFALIYGSGGDMATREDVIEHMRKWSIEKSFVMGFPFENGDYCCLQNEGLAAAGALCPETILPFASISPLCPDPAAVIEKLAGMGFAGVGEIAFYRAGLGGDREEWLDRLMTSAGEMSLAVCFHVNEPVGHAYAGKYMTDFSLLYRVIERHPDVTVILSHWGGGILFYELMPEVSKAFGRVYYDTAASPYLYTGKIYTTALAAVGSRKILFGTDYPLLDAGRYLKTIRSMEIGSVDMENLLDGNARRLIAEVASE